MAPPPVRVNDSDLHAVRAVGTNLLTPSGTLSHRGKSKVDRPLSNPPPESYATPGPTYGIPYEIVEMIIAYLTHNLGDLKACSLTSRSLYIATVPHLHHTLTLRGDGLDLVHSKLGPLYELRELALTHLVKEIRVEQLWRSDHWFAPQVLSQSDLCYLSALSNVHTLRLHDMEIYHFIPGIEHYFGHFSPTLRSITLLIPNCIPQQLSHFLSFFPNLDDIEIERGRTYIPNKSVPDTELVPFSAQKMRGRLTLRKFCWVDTLTHLMASCGGLQFHHVDLRESMGCVPTLLEACAETLETLRFNASDHSHSKSFCIG